MGFSDDVRKFGERTNQKMNDLQKSQYDAFLKEKLGEDFNLIQSYRFDDSAKRFYDVVAPDSVIETMKRMGYLRE